MLKRLAVSLFILLAVTYVAAAPPVLVDGKDSTGTRRTIAVDTSRNVLISGTVTATTVADTAGVTTECLVANAAGGTSCPASPLSDRKAVEIYNNGPNTIYCAVGTSVPVVSKSRPILPQGSWSLEVGDGIAITCISSALQVTGAATIVTEVK